MIIQLKGVSKFYGGFQALSNVSAAVQPGAIGLLGPNGAGKSTLIKSLLGLVRLTSGDAQVLGMDVRRQSREIRQRVGYMPEDDCYLAGLPAIQAVAYAGELAGLPPRTALRRAHEVLDYVGLAEERYREVQTYSTGMKQKMKLAQALIHAPKLVFLDEPTSGLDPQGRERMIKLIQNLAQKKGVSVVISTHILHDVEASCDSVLILSRGALRVYDTIANLRSSVKETWSVRITGDLTVFTKALVARGCAVRPSGHEEIEVAGPDASDHVFRAATEAGVIVRHVEAARTSLEEIFLDAVGA